MDKSIFIELEEFSEAELFEKLGSHLKSERRLLNESENNSDLGKSWYVSVRSELQKKVCPQAGVVGLDPNSSKGSIIELATAIADSITGYLSGVALATVSLLIAREGVRRFCNDFEKT